jgi:acyl-CoA dehydrogenase
MEVLARYGTPEHQERWLKPLLAGEIRSAFAMTEPAVASRRHQHRMPHRTRRRPLRDQRPQVVHHQRHRSALQDRDLHGQDRPRQRNRHQQQSMILVPGHPGRQGQTRAMPVFGYDGARRAQRGRFTDVRVPAANMLLGEGRGFEIAQGRLGPGASTTACA